MFNNRIVFGSARSVVGLLGLVVLLLAGPSTAQPGIASVAPDSAQPGEQNLSVVAELRGKHLPPDRLQPASFVIGSLAGRNIARDGTQVSAWFDFPADQAEGLYDVTVTFSTPQRERVFTLEEGFSVGDGSAAGDPESVTTGSYSGYTLFAPMAQPTTYLIDHDGNLVHTWDSSYGPNLSVYLLDDGSILRPASHAGSGLVERIAMDGSVVWSWSPADPDLELHHDVEPLPGGNVLMIAYDGRSAAEAIAAGRDPELVSGNGLWSECVIEVEPDGADGGTVVWKWCVWDHLIQDRDSTAPDYGVIAGHPERIDLNYAPRGAEDWLHANAIDYNAGLDQILLSLRSLSEIWIIDHSTSTAEAAGHSGGNANRGGDLLYRWGNPQVYGAGSGDDQTLFGQHDAQWIDGGLSGGGNILVFNNGQRRPDGNYSSVDEIVPPLDGYTYTLDADSAWSYTAPSPGDFYADHISGAQRLPNGNTLICDGPAGEFFEVTASAGIVWDYVNPYSVSTPRGDSAEVFRATRIAPDAAPIVALGLGGAVSRRR